MSRFAPAQPTRAASLTVLAAALLLSSVADAQQGHDASAPAASTAGPVPAASASVEPAQQDHAAPSIAASSTYRDSGTSADAGTTERTTPVVASVTGVVPPDVLRETPRQTVAGFMEAAAQEDFERAAYYLDLRSVPVAARKARGPELARLFAEVLERTVWVDVEAIPDDPDGLSAQGEPATSDIRVVNIPMPGGSQGVRLERVRDAATGSKVWLFSKATVQSIEKLHAEHGLPDAVQQLPTWSRRRFGGMQLWQWGGIVLLVLAAWIAGHIVERPSVWGIRRAMKRTEVRWLDGFATIAQGPIRRLAAMILVRAGVEYLGLSATAQATVTRLVDIGLILVGTHAAIRLVAFAAQTVLDEASRDDDDVARMKTVATRVTAMRRIANVIIFVVGVALALMQFPVARSAGWSLLGSAGIAGAILGFAAQKTMSNLFAGILIAITQPMRIGDTVIVEEEWGTIEEIGLTHVVVRIWDLRRLVLPVTWFLDQPFQNWTRTSTELIGTVFVHADFGVDVDAVRKELESVLKDHQAWNKKTSGVIVSELTDRTVLLRLTMSADDADKLWTLRCEVRERMLKFLQADRSRLPQWRLTPPTGS